jgi:pimeloyl-ACP methyl ester carboxylesterase
MLGMLSDGLAATPLPGAVAWARRLLHWRGGWEPLADAEGPPVLLIPGLGGSLAALHPLARYLTRELRRPVIPLAVGTGTRDVRSIATRLHAEIERLAEDAGHAYVDLVGHSLGGLVGSYLLKHVDRGRRIRRVVTLGTPHRGTPTAHVGVAFLGLVSRSMWQMRPRAAFLHWLEATPVPPGSEIIAVAGLADRVVPPRFALLRRQPGQSNRGIPGANHFTLILSKSAFEVVGEALDTAAGGAEQPTSITRARRWRGGMAPLRPPEGGARAQRGRGRARAGSWRR